MKKFFLMLAVGVAVLGVRLEQADAKSYLSRSFEDKYQRLGERETRSMLRRMGISGDDKEFTLSDLKNLKLSRREEKEIRAAKKNGTYKTPEEQFKEMDTNRDGKVNSAELQEYYARQAYREEPSKKDRNPDVSQYGKPLPELTPEQEALHDEMIAKAVASEEEINEINENPALTSSEKEEKIKAVKEKYYPETKESGNPDDEKTAGAAAAESVKTDTSGDNARIEGESVAIETDEEGNAAGEKTAEEGGIVKNETPAGENDGVSGESAAEDGTLQKSGGGGKEEVSEGTGQPPL